MNLHDVPPRRPKTFGEFAAEMLQRPLTPYQEQFVQRIATQPPRMVPIPDPLAYEWWRDPLTTDRPTVRALPEPEAIVERLHRQWIEFERHNMGPHRLTEAAFVLRRQEWYVIRRYFDWHEIQRHFGEQVEGAFPRFRGYPLVIVP